MKKHQVLLSISLLAVANLNAMTPYERRKRKEEWQNRFERRNYLEKQKECRQLSPAEESEYQEAREEALAYYRRKYNTAPAKQNHNTQPNDTHTSSEKTNKN